MTLGRGLATAAQGVINLAKRKSWRNIPQAGGSGVVSTNGNMYQLAPIEHTQILTNTSGSQDIPIATDYTTTYLDNVFGNSRGSVIYRGSVAWNSLAGGSTGTFLQSKSRSDPTWVTAATSIALSMPVQFSVAGSPITSTGTFTVTWATEAANKVLAGPTTGAATVPTFRSLVAADIPDLSGTYLALAGGTMTGVLTAAGGSGASPSINLVNGGFYKNNSRTGVSVSIGGAEAAWWDLSGGGLVAGSTFSIGSAAIIDTDRLILTRVFATGSLPAGSNGARATVSDSSVVASGNFGAIVAGGGTNKVPVFHDGTNWRIG